MGVLWFVTGGARSGKSRHAERLAGGAGRPVVYITTMEPGDEELHRRIEHHRSQRPRGWETVDHGMALRAP